MDTEEDFNQNKDITSKPKPKPTSNIKTTLDSKTKQNP